jgi:hypothetical protein
MRFIRISIAVAVTAAAFVAISAGPAAATTVSACQDQISLLAQQTAAVPISGPYADNDRAGLLGKLQNASTKLSQGKFADAIQKLDDFEAKVVQLRDAGKLAAADADTLLAGAGDAITCISGIGV